MEHGAHVGHAEDDARPRRRLTAWRVATPIVVVLAGGLMAVSAANSEGTDLRPGRYTDLASLVETEADQYAVLEGRVHTLEDDVTQLSSRVENREIRHYRRQAERLADPAGLTPRTGPGLTITLSDAPEDKINASTENLNLLVVHQQDIQAVVNALWNGGASAVTVQGQRIITTTGIKCEGNAVQLQGVPYGQPYVIQAVGDPARLQAAIDASDYLDIYRQQAADPAIGIGWAEQEEAEVTAPAYAGLLDLSYAQPLR
jgi:uncharacterized protein YlxW (UPF0749 family)